MQHLTGLGGDIFIIDDPQKPADAQSETLRNSVTQWFSNTLRSRLDNKETGVIILVMQRVHLLDLTGYLTENSDEWTVLALPAIAEEDEKIAMGPKQYYHRRIGEALHPTYESLSTLQRLRNEVGSDVFAAQYQQAPVPPGGAMIRRQWLRYYDVAPERTYRTKVIQSLGHRGQERRSKRLVGLHDLACRRQALLSARRHAWPVRIPSTCERRLPRWQIAISPA